MSFSGLLLRLHLLLLLAFVLFYAIKATLLFLGRAEVLRGLRANTRLVDSGLGILILGSGVGGLALYPGAVPGWLWGKLALVLLLLPLAIAAMRRQYKPGIAAALLGLLYAYGTAEASRLTPPRPALPPANTAALGRPETVATPDAAPLAGTSAARPSGLSEAEAATLEAASASAALASPPAEPTGAVLLAEGQALFTKNCAVCHGPDGRLGRNGAHNLTKSNLNAAGRTYLVTQGLGKMPSFKAKLTPVQIQQVVAYSLTLQ